MFEIKEINQLKKGIQIRPSLEKKHKIFNIDIIVYISLGMEDNGDNVREKDI